MDRYGGGRHRQTPTVWGSSQQYPPIRTIQRSYYLLHRNPRPTRIDTRPACRHRCRSPVAVTGSSRIPECCKNKLGRPPRPDQIRRRAPSPHPALGRRLHTAPTVLTPVLLPCRGAVCGPSTRRYAVYSGGKISVARPVRRAIFRLRPRHAAPESGDARILGARLCPWVVTASVDPPRTRRRSCRIRLGITTSWSPARDQHTCTGHARHGTRFRHRSHTRLGSPGQTVWHGSPESFRRN